MSENIAEVQKAKESNTKKFIDEQNRLYKEYGLFLPVGTKILGVSEDGKLEVRGFLDIDGTPYNFVPNHRDMFANERGESKYEANRRSKRKSK